ncbi:CubicO group peptidase, beta-lactamase class C family [Micromonospora citrea]|uniref:CubicO group peptidase, beta-lactamase class C family n=1 Tax=Micromonospora citrea TaxID=47855 RepID=A0A1C6TXC6_9ACTN|nr:serine hydrolase domain-containing protein [Micromonospora citrea]SCL46261.1 CubicO group peptidase, beta-lactamase class C family [Micromonospora citrea]
MRPQLRRFAVALAAVGALAITSGPPASAAGDETDRVRTYLDHYRKTNHIPGLAAAVVRGDRVVQEHLAGVAGDGTPVTAQTPFLYGSVSKPFTALAVLQLAEDGRISLDAPARVHLPWLRLSDEAATARVTVRQLLTHTSGLPEVITAGLTDRYDNAPGGVARAVRDLADVPLAGQPGSEHRYSDANYMVLGALVEEVTGRPFAEHLRRSVLDPLRMRQAAATAADAERLGLPAGHRRYLGRAQEFDPPYDTSGVPYGYLAGSLTDLGNFAAAQLNEGRFGESRLLSADGVTRMHRGQAPIASGGRYALGWRDTVLSGSGARTVWHAGATPGFFAHVVLVPEADLAVILLANLYHPAADPALASAGFDVARILLGVPPQPATNDTLLLSVAPALFGVAGLLMIVLIATVVRGTRRHRADPRTGRRAVATSAAWALGWAAGAGAALLVLPSLVGGLGLLLLWTPDIGHATVAVAALAGLLALAHTTTALARLRARRARPAAGDLASTSEPVSVG